MLGKRFVNLLRNSYRPQLITPKRNWAQVGIIMSTPARYPISYTEKLMHALFMYVVWISPIAYLVTRVKYWRRIYIKAD